MALATAMQHLPSSSLLQPPLGTYQPLATLTQAGGTQGSGRWPGFALAHSGSCPHPPSASRQQVQLVSRGSLGYTCSSMAGDTGTSLWGPQGGMEKRRRKKKFFNLLATHELLPFCTYFQSIYFSTLEGAGINVTLQQVTHEQSHKCGWPHAQILCPNFPGSQE